MGNKLSRRKNSQPAVIVGSTPADTGATIDDADGVVINDGGTMKQVAASRVWSFLLNKLSGAVSTALTSNLTANKLVVTDSSGKLAAANYVANRLIISNAVGNVSISNAIPASRALASNASGLPEAASTTTTELNNVCGTTSRDTAVTLEDGDGVVVNDNGTMMQAAMSRVWVYIQSKITGAVSGVLTSNLTANKILISDSSGKIAAVSLGATRIMVTDSSGLPSTIPTLTANRLMMTDANGLPNVAANGPVYYTNSVSAAGTYTVVSGFKGGFTVSFIRTASVIYLQVTHSQLGSRYQYQTTTNGGSPASFWTSSSGQNYPANLPSIATNGASIGGWFFGVDGNTQTDTIRVDFNIISNGASTSMLWCCVS